MNTLFIDTHSEKLFIAVVSNGRIYSKEKVGIRSHSEIAIPTLQEVLEDANLKLENIDQIIVVNGPGSFTGVRIGVTIAKTLAYSLNIPIKTITSLEVYGISSTLKFDVVTVKDSKGVYSARLKNNKYVDYEYRKNREFEEFVQEKGYNVLNATDIDLDRVLDYMKNVSPTNPHKVNPIYIKEIDALKW